MALIGIGILFVGSVLFFGSGLLSTLIAWKKGYRPWFWLLAMGPVGTVWMLVTPPLDQATTPEQREQWETRADWAGGILSGISALPMVAVPLFLIGSIYFVIGPRPAPPPMPAIQAAPSLQIDTPDGSVRDGNAEPADPDPNAT